MKFLILAAFFAAPSVHAQTRIEAGANASVMIAGDVISLQFSKATAAELFDALTVRETPGWEDSQISSKSARGIFCNDERAGSGRETSCELRANAATGFDDAAPKGNADTALILEGEPAATVYSALLVKEVAQDAEGFTFSKSTSGLSCERNGPTKSYSCWILIDSAQGVIR